MIKNVTPPTITSPRGIDIAINEVNSALITKLEWLTLAFKKSETLKRLIDGNELLFPTIYVGGVAQKEYISLFPDSQKGNFCFWKIEDGQDNLNVSPANVFLIADFRLVFWFDFRDVYASDFNNRTIEHVKAEINEFFRTTKFQNAVFQIERFWEETENIYSGYDYQQIGDLYRMRPYGALAITGRMRYYERSKCFTDQPDLPAWITPSGQQWIQP